VMAPVCSPNFSGSQPMVRVGTGQAEKLQVDGAKPRSHRAPWLLRRTPSRALGEQYARAHGLHECGRGWQSDRRVIGKDASPGSALHDSNGEERCDNTNVHVRFNAAIRRETRFWPSPRMAAAAC
jgi:hypothetical protein